MKTDARIFQEERAEGIWDRIAWDGQHASFFASAKPKKDELARRESAPAKPVGTSALPWPLHFWFIRNLEALIVSLGGLWFKAIRHSDHCAGNFVRIVCQEWDYNGADLATYTKEDCGVLAALLAGEGTSDQVDAMGKEGKLFTISAQTKIVAHRVEVGGVLIHVKGDPQKLWIFLKLPALPIQSLIFLLWR